MKIILIFLYLTLPLPLLAQVTKNPTLSWLEPDWSSKLFEPLIRRVDPTAQPPDDVQQAIKSVTSPVISSVVAYRKLYNKTVDENNILSNGIAWAYVVIRFHESGTNEEKKGDITGWSIIGGADYFTVKAFEKASRAFKGTWEEKNGVTAINWDVVGENGETPKKKEGFESFKGTADPDNNTISGDWSAYCKKLEREGMQEQFGKMNSYLLSSDGYSFDMNKVNRDSSWDDQKANNQIQDFNTMALIFGADYFPYFFTHEQQEQLVAYYVHKAWESYKKHLPADLISEEKEKDITKNFRVNLGKEFTSKIQNTKVPLQFSTWIDKSFNKWIFNISWNFFLNSEKSNQNTRISKFAHEILGHGIIHRYYVNVPVSYIRNIKISYVNTKEEGDEENSKIGKITTQISEGFAVCVEYNVLKNLGETQLTLIEFATDEYKKDTQDFYVPGVQILQNDKFITTAAINNCTDTIDWKKVKDYHAAQESFVSNLVKTGKFKFFSTQSQYIFHPSSWFH